MAEVTWTDSGGQPVVEVTVGEVKYTIPDGVPTDIPQEHLAAVKTALTALAETVAATTSSDTEI